MILFPQDIFLISLAQDPPPLSLNHFMSIFQPQMEFPSSYIQKNQMQVKLTSIICFVEPKLQSKHILSTGVRVGIKESAALDSLY